MIEKKKFIIPVLHEHASVTPGDVLSEFHRLSAESREALEFHIPRKDLQSLWDFIHKGNPQAVVKWFCAQTEGLPLGLSLKDPLQQMRCLFIGAIILFAQAAEEGGVEPELTHNLNNAYISRAVTADMERLQALLPLAAVDFAQRVEAVNRSEVPAVNICRSYVHNHLHYKITLNALARETGLSPNHLSALFHRETGMGLKAYILGEKLQAAALLLRESSLSVAQVAFQFGFCSHSNFSARFKEKFGVSPAQYRAEKK